MPEPGSVRVVDVEVNPSGEITCPANDCHDAGGRQVETSSELNSSLITHRHTERHANYLDRRLRIWLAIGHSGTPQTSGPRASSGS